MITALFRLAVGKLKLNDRYHSKTVEMQDSGKFTIFRHISQRNEMLFAAGTVFIVRFKFARLSHRANKKASVIPMLMIAGFPGFVQKIYAVNPQNGYWQGMYQWESSQSLEEYKKSFVFRIMNKRAVPETVSSFEIENEKLSNFIESNCSFRN
jgi:hypothetical protein